jgi:hypothetical protein
LAKHSVVSASGTKRTSQCGQVMYVRLTLLHVRYWPKADMRELPFNVCFRG